MLKNVLGTSVGIMATGLLLYFAGTGKLSQPVKELAQKITAGYGV